MGGGFQTFLIFWSTQLDKWLLLFASSGQWLAVVVVKIILWLLAKCFLDFLVCLEFVPLLLWPESWGCCCSFTASQPVSHHHNRSCSNALICQWFGCAVNRRTYPWVPITDSELFKSTSTHPVPLLAGKREKLNTRHVYNILRAAAPMKRSSALGPPLPHYSSPSSSIR